MTKPRKPVSIEAAVFRVLGNLTIERASEETGRKPAYLRALTDPDKREALTVVDLIALDLAHVKGGGSGSPLYETVGLMLKAARAEVFSDAAAIHDAARKVIKEGGEASLAIFEASQPEASAQARRAALTELEQSAAATSTAIAVIKAVIEQGDDRQPP